MLIKQPRILILSEPRTGSNNVANVLNIHPDLIIGNELFHPTNGLKIADFPELILDESQQIPGKHWLCSLNPDVRHEIVSSVFSNYNGFKIHTDHLPPSVILEIVENFECTVIVTIRRNIFEQAISNFVATRKAHWHADEKIKLPIVSETWTIKPEAFISWITRLLSIRRDLYQELQSTDINIALCEYENIYSGEFEKRYGKFAKLFDIIGVQKFGQLAPELRLNAFKRAKHFLDPENQKMTNELSAAAEIENYENLKYLYEVWRIEKFDIRNLF
jgi:hypothetical protein